MFRSIVEGKEMGRISAVLCLLLLLDPLHTLLLWGLAANFWLFLSLGDFMWEQGTRPPALRSIKYVGIQGIQNMLRPLTENCAPPCPCHRPASVWEDLSKHRSCVWVPSFSLSLIKNPNMTYVRSHSSTDLFLQSVLPMGGLVFNMSRKLSLVYHFWTLLPPHLNPTLYNNFVTNLLFLIKCFFPSAWHWSFTWIKSQIVKICHAQIEIMRQIWRDEDLAHTFYSHFLWPCLWGG